MSAPNRTPLSIWLILIAATALTFAAGEWVTPGRTVVVGVLGLAMIKARLVILDFMELRHAPALWRRIVIGWLLLVIAGIVFAYLRGSS